jgi:hypothetical protein
MAEQGGYRRPTTGATYSGVGKNSRRTDGRQAIRSPNVQDSTDLSQGDRERIVQGQRMRPLSEAPTPPVAPPPTGGGGGAAGIPMPLPPIMPSSRPEEPITEGMPFGPGAGPEVLTPPPRENLRLEALERYARIYDNPHAKRILARERQPQPMPMPAVAAMPDSLPQPPEPEPVATEDVAVEGEEDTLSVETPEAATPSLETTE